MRKVWFPLLVIILTSCISIPIPKNSFQLTVPWSGTLPKSNASVVPSLWRATSTATPSPTQILFFNAATARIQTPWRSRTPTETKGPTDTKTPVSTYNLSSEPSVAFLFGHTIFLADSNGGVMPVYNFAQSTRFDTIFMKLSPDKKNLALTWINDLNSPVLTIIDLEFEKWPLDQTFEGSYIGDFAWSPDSTRIFLSVISVKPKGGFDSQLVMITPWMPDEKGMSQFRSGDAVVQMEWPADDTLVFLNFSCRESSYQYDSMQRRYKAGKGSVNILNVYSSATKSKEVADVGSGFYQQIIISPDAEKILFIRPGRYDIWGPVNLLLDRTNLANLTCPFCKGFSDAIWFKSFLLGTFPSFGIPDGDIFLINTQTGEAQYYDHFGTFEPIWRPIEISGRTILIHAWDISYYPPPVIGAEDFSECLVEGAESFTCGEWIWSLEGSHPDSFDFRQREEVDCCMGEEGCYPP